jgi:hypothetical protein
MEDIKVLAFDTGGTVLDWHAGRSRHGAPPKASSATGTRWRTSIAAARCTG